MNTICEPSERLSRPPGNLGGARRVESDLRPMLGPKISGTGWAPSPLCYIVQKHLEYHFSLPLRSHAPFFPFYDLELCNFVTQVVK